MKLIRPFLSLVLPCVWGLFPLAAEEDQASKKDQVGEVPVAEVEEPTDFIRIDEDDKAARLQTSVTRYEKEGVTVDLIGAVHIGDKKYYEDLNRSFEKYDVLLFEMVGG